MSTSIFFRGDRGASREHGANAWLVSAIEANVPLNDFPPDAFLALDQAKDDTEELHHTDGHRKYAGLSTLLCGHLCESICSEVSFAQACQDIDTWSLPMRKMIWTCDAHATIPKFQRDMADRGEVWLGVTNTNEVVYGGCMLLSASLFLFPGILPTCLIS